MVQAEFGFDRLCGNGPDERLGVPVAGCDVAGNRLFELRNGAEGTPPQALAGSAWRRSPQQRWASIYFVTHRGRRKQR